MELPKIRDNIFNSELKMLINNITHQNYGKNISIQEDFFYFFREDRNILEKRGFLELMKKRLYTDLERGYKAAQGGNGEGKRWLHSLQCQGYLVSL
jgi:hypothetical protein